MNYTFEHIAEVLLAAPYTFAKTMPHIPHSYCHRNKWNQPIPYTDVVEYIIANGTLSIWGRNTYHYLYLNGERWWTMEQVSPAETTILNRAVPMPQHKPRAHYDTIAGDYDDLYDDGKYIEEERKLFEALVPTDPESMLDIGCGTGMALDWCNPAEYVGLDPSQGMLDRISSKFDTDGMTLICDNFENFHMPRQFEMVLCLFGVANYMAPNSVERLYQYVKPGGRAIVLFQKPNYDAPIHVDGSVNQKTYAHSLDKQRGESFDVGPDYVAYFWDRPLARTRKRKEATA